MITRRIEEISQETAMLSAICDVCDAILSFDDDFWLVAMLTDWSFETAGSAKFRRAVRSFTEAGLPVQTAERLAKGVNGNFVELIESRHSHLKPVHGNRGHGKGTRPDFRFGATGTGQEVIGEIKVVYDLTIPAFYGHKDRHGVADDRDKLLKIRAAGFAGHLFQIVFFAQLPNFDYPPGCWYAPAWKHCVWARRQYAGYRGIDAQYRYLRTLLTDEPIGTAAGPTIRRLSSPSDGAITAMSSRFASVFRPDDGDWKFNPLQHLAEAAVGYSIWTY
jgi:hypothetical protein